MSAPSPPRHVRPRRSATDTHALALAAQQDTAVDHLSSSDDDIVAVARPPPAVAGPSHHYSHHHHVAAPAPVRKKPGPKPRADKTLGDASNGGSKKALGKTAAGSSPKKRRIEDALGLTIISALEFPLDEPEVIGGSSSSRSTSLKPAGVAGASKDGANGVALSDAGAAPPLGGTGAGQKEHPLQAFLNNPAVAQPKEPKAPVFDLRSVKTSSPRTPLPRTQPRPFNLGEAPTFYPTADEFRDALAYVRKIGKEGGAERFGICKIVPPPGWEMPFVMDTETFKFKTRLMRLNSIEAKSRAKLNFLEQLSMFHAQQGNPRLKVPVIDKRELDLWALRKEVSSRGGSAAVSQARAWGAVCRKVGLAPSFAQSVRGVYGRVIAPYDDYAVRAKNTLARMSPRKKAAPAPAPAPTASRRRRSSSLSTLPTESPVKPSAAPEESPNKARKRLAEAAARMFLDGDSDLTDTDEETIRMVAEPVAGPSGRNGKKRRASILSISSADELAGGSIEDVCEVCQKGDRPTKMLLCDGCDLGFHIFCLDPPLEDIPNNDTWYCPSCLIGNGAEFGFDEGDEHSLSSFQKRDTAFSEYWWAMHPPKTKGPSRGPFAESDADDDEDSGAERVVGEHVPNGVERIIGGTVVSEHDVEAEFWRLVDSKTETVEVEYGADVHSTIHGSAAPTIETHPLEPYAIDQWNLNNLSILPDSLLRYVKTQISGCTVPWIYVGHLFSAFCWHNEDHHTHSINHMHWGETKTWYGVPGEDAEKFEEALRREAPDLFEQDPALLFQLVTLMNPGRLRRAGVRVYALDQRANEIVVTFPKAFHAGFNHGLNYNEAVNFATRDWLPDDLDCVRKYQEHSKAPVFSHDELLVSIAQNSPTIDTALWLAASFEEMVAREREARADLRTGPFALAETIQESDLPEEKYQCAECKVFTYLSQIVCSGCSAVLCHAHSAHECTCAPGVVRSLRIRYADAELETMRIKIADNAALPTMWREKFAKVLQSSSPSLKSLRALVIEAEQIEKMTSLPELDPLRVFVGRCNEIVQEAITLLTRKHKSRKGRISGFEGEDGEDRTLDGVREVLRQADRLGFEASEIAQLKHVLSQALAFAKEADELLQSPDSEQTLIKVEALYATGSSLGLNLPQCFALEKISKRMHWLSDLDEVDESSLDLADIESYLDLARRNDVSAEHPFVKVLEERRARGQAWRLAAESLLAPNAPVTVPQLDQNIAEANETSVDNGILHRIKQLRHKALDFQRQARALLDAFRKGPSPEPELLGDIQRFLRRVDAHKGISSVALDEIKALRDVVWAVEDWRSDYEWIFGQLEMTLDEVLTAVQQRMHPDDDEPSSAPAAASRVSASPAPSTPQPDATSPAVGIHARPLRRFSCVCRLPEEEGPSLQCIKCHETYHGKCVGVPLKSVKVFKRYVCPVCDPKKVEAWPEAWYKYKWGMQVHFDMLRDDLPKLRFAMPEARQLEELCNLCAHLVELIKQNVSGPRPADPAVSLHLLRKLEQLPIHPQLPGPPTDRPSARDLLLAEGGFEKKRARKQNPRWEIVGQASSKNPDVVQCFCNNHPPQDAAVTALCNNRKCMQRYHASCLLVPPPPPAPYDPASDAPPPAEVTERSFKCPICCIKQGTRYQHAELRLQMAADLRTNRYVDYRQTLALVDTEAPVKQILPQATYPSVTLVATSFTPGVKGDPKPNVDSRAAIGPAAGPSTLTAEPLLSQGVQPPAWNGTPDPSYPPVPPAPAPIQYRSLPASADDARPPMPSPPAL